MSKDPVSIAELRHDIDSAARLYEQDRLEAEFRRDPDWDLVAECLIKRETVGDLCALLWAEAPWLTETVEGPLEKLSRAQIIVGLAVLQCAQEYAERNISI